MKSSKLYRLLQRCYFVFRSNCDSLYRLFIRQKYICRSHRRLEDLRNLWAGCTVFVVGNGPSLNEEQIKLLARTKFIATNRAYQIFDPSSFSSGGNGFIIINDIRRVLEVLPGLSQRIQQVVFGCPDPKDIYTLCSFPHAAFTFAKCIWRLRFKDLILTLDDNDKAQLFSPDFAKGFYPGHSVAFSAIQLAAYLGAKRIVLIGCDMTYSGPNDYSPLIRSDRHSLGHVGFFDYALHGRKHLLACQAGLAAMNIELLNATPGGAIMEIPRVLIHDLTS
jgi:hypothetical protein